LQTSGKNQEYEQAPHFSVQKKTKEKMDESIYFCTGNAAIRRYGIFVTAVFSIFGAARFKQTNETTTAIYIIVIAPTKK
jgi:hypothetical protein